MFDFTGIFGKIIDVIIFNKKEREERINKVVDEYVRLAASHPPINSGISGLIQSGVALLKDGKEVQDVIDRIEARALKSPVNRYKDILKDVDLKKLFVLAIKKDLARTSFESIIDEAKRRED